MIKLKVQTVWLRELPQPTGKSDKHPELNALSQCKQLFTVSIYGKEGREEASLCRKRDIVLWLNTERRALSICPGLVTCFIFPVRALIKCYL